MCPVIGARNCRGRAIHLTEKPSGPSGVLVRTSRLAGGLVTDGIAGSGMAGNAWRLAGQHCLEPEMAARTGVHGPLLPFTDGASR